MATTAQIDPAREAPVRGPRQQKLPTTLLALLLISLLATGISVAGFFVPGAVVSALFVALFYGLMVAFKIRDRRAWARARAADTGPGPSTRLDPDVGEEDLEEIAPDVSREIVAAERAGFRLGVIIVAPLAALAVLLAAVFVGWKVIGLGALAMFAFMILFGAPVWLAAMEDEIEEAEEKIGVETHSIR